MPFSALNQFVHFDPSTDVEPWDATLNISKASFTLNTAAQRELKRFLGGQGILENLQDVHGIEFIMAESKLLPETMMEIARLDRCLTHGCRFALIQPVEGLSPEQQMAVPWVISNLLGTTLGQNEAGDRFYIVTDRGGKMEEGARYSQTNQGGSFHTDGVNLKEGYDYFLLGCVAPAIRGGESILLDGFTILRELQSNDPEVLEILGRDLNWEYKGIFKDQFYQEPILKISRNQVHWRYLRNYIEEAAVKTGVPLSFETIHAMDRLDEALAKPSFQLRYALKAGETLAINDRTLFHGRTPFEDAPEAVPLEAWLGGSRNRPIKRTYSRFWVNRRPSATD
jgi:hypothetical protein